MWSRTRSPGVSSDGSDAETIPFTVETDIRYHEPLRSKRNPGEETLTARLIRWPVVSPDGNALVFAALGHVYWMALPDGTPQRVTGQSALEFSPSFSPDGDTLAFTSWSDEDGAAVHTVRWRRSVTESGDSGRRHWPSSVSEIRKRRHC